MDGKRIQKPVRKIDASDLRGPAEEVESKLEGMSRMELLASCWGLDISFETTDSTEDLRGRIRKEAFRQSLDSRHTRLVAQLAIGLGEADGEFTQDEVEEAQRAAELDLSRLDEYARRGLAECVELLGDEEIDPKEVALELRVDLGDDEIESLMDYLFDISVADGVFHPKEEEFLRAVQEVIGADPVRFERQIRLCKVASGVANDEADASGGLGRAEDGAQQAEHDDDETGGNEEPTRGEAERARIALHYVYEKLPVDHEDVAAAIVQVEGEDSPVVTWLHDGNGFSSREESFVRIGELVTRFDKDGIEFVEQVIEEIAHREVASKKEESEGGATEGQRARELMSRLFEKTDNRMTHDHVYRGLKRVLTPEEMENLPEFQDRTHCVEAVGEVVDSMGYDLEFVVELARAIVEAQQRAEPRVENSGGGPSGGSEREAGRTGRNDKNEKVAELRSGDNSAQGAASGDTQATTSETRKRRGGRREHRGTLTRQDSVWMLHPSDKLMHTLKRLGVRTIAELLSFEVEDSFLRPDGDTAREVLKLRDEAKERLEDRQAERRKSGMKREIGKLYGLLREA